MCSFRRGPPAEGPQGRFPRPSEPGHMDGTEGIGPRMPQPMTMPDGRPHPMYQQMQVRGELLSFQQCILPQWKTWSTVIRGSEEKKPNEMEGQVKRISNKLLILPKFSMGDWFFGYIDFFVIT